MSGVPTVIIDGKYAEVGGGNGCEAEYNLYLNDYNRRMTETNGTSPVDISGYFAVGQNSGSLQATFTLLDATDLGIVQGTFFVYEDSISWCCGAGGVSQWSEITRVIHSAPVTLTHAGDTAVLTRDITFGSGWNPANLHAVAILQQTGGAKTIVQAARLTSVVDFALDMPKRLASVPHGYGMAEYSAVLQNVGNSPDVLSLSVDQAMEWPTDFQVSGDPNWYTDHAIPLAPGADIGVTVRVRTDGDKRIGAGTFSVQSARSGRTDPCALRLFNGSPAIILVDNDNGNIWPTSPPVPCETPFINSLNSLGYLFDHWDTAGGHAGARPAAADLSGYDLMIWETGTFTSAPISSGDALNIEAYLDAGGRLYLDSMDLAGVYRLLPEGFSANYLGVASYAYRTRAHTDTGVPGDPITDGMVLPLNWFSGDQPDRVSTINPMPGARAILYSETNNPNALRYARSSFRVVFSSVIENAISDSAPPPNNEVSLLGQILAWLLQQDQTAVPAPPGVGVTRILAADPNPFSLRVTLRFRLSATAASAPVRLSLVDASGRLVRTLAEGRLPEGPHAVVWDGRDEAGRSAASGVYFARLASRDGLDNRKLVRMK